MNVTRSPSNSPRSLKRVREVDGQDTPLYIPPSSEPNSFSRSPHNDTRDVKEDPSSISFDPIQREHSPARSSTGSLSDRSRTPSFSNSPAPLLATLNGVVPPPKKRVKLSFAEKEERRILKAIREQEKAEEKAQREAEKKVKEEEKARREAEREAERKKKDAEKEEKRIVREAKEAEKEKERKAKEDEKRRKEEEKQKFEEEKKKKERSQPKLNAFFKKPKIAVKDESSRRSPSPSHGAPSQSDLTVMVKSPSKDSEYQRRFPMFFTKSNVKLAPAMRFERDDRASEIVHDMIDSYLSGKQASEKQLLFDAASLFHVSNMKFKARGKRITPVRDIMSGVLGGSERPIDLTTDSQNIQIKNTRVMLKQVPYKIFQFYEDVRPPYKGTYTNQPLLGVRRLARNPLRRELPHVNYDYDSEAEWEVEEGEDVDSDGEEEEDIGDGEEDLAEFLDDEDAEAVNARKLVIHGDLEPKSWGLCFEDENRRGPNVKMYRYLMEMINVENSRIKTPIDPFAMHYWDAPTSARSMEPPRIPLNAKSTNVGVNGIENKTMKMFGTSDSKKSTTLGSDNGKPLKRLVPSGDMAAFRKAIEGSELSKIGLIEVLNKQFSKISKSTIKTTLETIAKRVGTKEAEKRWALIDSSTE